MAPPVRRGSRPRPTRESHESAYDLDSRDGRIDYILTMIGDMASQPTMDQETAAARAETRRWLAMAHKMCTDRDQEAHIAELEARIAELKAAQQATSDVIPPMSRTMTSTAAPTNGKRKRPTLAEDDAS